ncbi:MAG TPA: RNA-binding protein, partial [Methanomicrobiales archaeon]|nr:RNA-binding protein [Methanomicrobiales archaeon]
PFHYIDLRAFCYATEDDQRVEDALDAYLPDEVEIERIKSEGHLGDRILILSARVENADEMRHILGKLRELDDIEQVRGELDQRVDDNCSFFISLDKQAAYRGEARLGQGITLRAKVEAYPAKKNTAVENAREALS